MKKRIRISEGALARLVKECANKALKEGDKYHYDPNPDDNWQGHGRAKRERWDADEIPYEYKQRPVRISESDLRSIVRESIVRMLREGKYDTELGGFNNTAWMYDDAIDSASDEDEFDKMMDRRKAYIDVAAKNAMDYHPQNSVKSVASAKYAHPEWYGMEDDEVLNDFENGVEYRKKQNGFAF